MKHEKSLSTAKSTMAAATHKSRQLLESNATTRGPITKALDFLAWPRSRSKSTHKEPELNLSNAKALQSTKTGNKGEVHYQRNIFRSGGGLIRDILAEKLQKDPNKTPTPSSHVSPCQRAQQRKLKPLSRNKSLDIHELIDNVERELEGNALSKHSAQQQRFLDDTFIDHVLRADSTDALRPQARHKHILFNDENTVYLIKKEQPVTQHTVGRGQTSKQTSPVAGKRSAQGGANGEVLKARLKFKRLPSEPDFYNNNYKQHHNHQELHRQLVQRRQSLCEGYYEQQSSSSMSSMGSAGSTGAGIVLERPKTDKPRKKLSFREPIVAGQPTAAAALRARRRSSPLERTSKNNDAPAGVVTMAAQNGNCDNLYNNRTKDAISCGCAVPSTGEPESQAMRIVRTVGQAFEVCHKFNLHKNSLEPNDERSDVSSELLDVEQISEHQLSDDGGAGETPKKEHMTIMPDLNHKQPQRPNHLELLPQPGLRKSPSLLRDVEDKSPSTPSSPRTEVSQLKDQLEAQATQTRQALAQLMLVREQLISETNARIEAQARTQQLLQQNRELLEHLASLGAYNEQQSAGLTSANIGMAPQLSSTAKVARWFQQLPWHTASLSRPESGFVSGDSRSEKYQEDHFYGGIAKETDDLCDEFLLVEGSSTIWTKLSAKKRRKLLGMRLGKVTTF